MLDSILFNSHHVPGYRRILHEPGLPLLLDQLAPGRRGDGLHFEEQQGSILGLSGWRPAVLKSLPGVSFLHLHVSLHRHDVICIQMLDVTVLKKK